MQQQTTGAGAAAPAPATGTSPSIANIAKHAVEGAVTQVLSKSFNIPNDELGVLLAGLGALLNRLFGHHAK